MDETDNISGSKELLHFANENLKQYESVWDTMDQLFVIRPTDFSYCFDWRQQAETKMGGGMAPQEIINFVKYFLKSLPPEQYYNSLYNSKKPYLFSEIVIDNNRTVVSSRSLRSPDQPLAPN